MRPPSRFVRLSIHAATCLTQTCLTHTSKANINCRDAPKQNIIPRAPRCFVRRLFMQMAFARQQKPAATMTLMTFCAAGVSASDLVIYCDQTASNFTFREVGFDIFTISFSNSAKQERLVCACGTFVTITTRNNRRSGIALAGG